MRGGSRWDNDVHLHLLWIVVGAGNSFLGGLAAGMALNRGNVVEGESTRPAMLTSLSAMVLMKPTMTATFYATVSASFTIEQQGLPILSSNPGDEPRWNGDSPARRVDELKARHLEKKINV